MAKRCYYEILGVVRTSTEVEITKAYRGLAKKYHPDQNPGDETVVAHYHEVTEAYEVLKDPQKRQVYDRYGHEGLSRAAGGGGGPDLSGFFGDLIDGLEGMFGGGGRRKSRGPRRGHDIEGVIDIDLVEAATGATKQVNVRYIAGCKACAGAGARAGTKPAPCRRCKGSGEEVMYLGPIAMQQACRGCGGRGQVITDPCPACRGAGRVEVEETVTVTIPCGVDTGTVLDPIIGHGHEGQPGAPRGNLLLVTRVRPHKGFKRNGHNLECRHAISFARAALGGPVEVAALTGERVTVEVPRGSQTDTVLRARGHGMPDLGDPRLKGDLLVQLVVETPTNLGPEQEQLFRRLAELEGFTPPPPPKGIFGKLKDLITGETPQTEQDRKSVV